MLSHLGCATSHSYDAIKLKNKEPYVKNDDDNSKALAVIMNMKPILTVYAKVGHKM